VWCGENRELVGAREAYHRPFDLFDERDGGGDGKFGDGALFFLCAANLFVFRCLSVYLSLRSRSCHAERRETRERPIPTFRAK